MRLGGTVRRPGRSSTASLGSLARVISRAVPSFKMECLFWGTLLNLSVIFFTEIGPRLAEHVRAPPDGSFMDYLGARYGPSVFLWPTSPQEIVSICQGLDISKGPGHDDISPLVLRYVSSEIAVPLSGMINACLEVGQFHDFLKVARVTPVFKVGDPT